jgi:enoyl-CoA hydratase/carnithine racemase
VKYGDIEVNHEGYVAVLEIQRPPNNHFDVALVNSLADALKALDEDTNTRALVLCSAGKHFCAGRNFADPVRNAEEAKRPDDEINPLYAAAVKLFSAKKPLVCAVQGAAVGGGFGLAVMADFRVVCPEARFVGNFVKLGFHPGFGLTHTLPKLIGHQKANLMLMTGRRIKGETAYEWGLADILTDSENLRSETLRLAAEIAENAPLAVQSVRATMRQGLAETVQTVTDWENIEQARLQKTEDHKEGVRAVAERRPGNFVGR